MDFVIEDKISVTPLYSVAEYESQRNVVGVDALIAGNTFVFPYIHVPNYYPSNNIFKYYPNVNKGALTHITANEWADKKEDFRNSLAPGVRLSYILGKIATRLKLKLSGDWWAEPEAKRLFFWTGLTLDEVVEEENGGVKRYINRWRKSFQTGEFLPDITAKELLQMLSKNFGVYYKVVNDKLILEKKKTLYQRKSRDFTPYLLPESLRFEPYTGKGIKLSYNFDKEATIPPDQLQPLSIGDAATAYTLDMITLPMVGFRFKKPQYWEKENTKANILLFDRATNSLFRDAASDNKNAEGVIIPGAWSLAFEGTAGLYRLHLKDIAELVNESKATALFDLPSEELTALQRGDYVRIHANTPNGTLRAVIKTISIKPSVQDLGFAEIEMLRI